MGNMTDSYSEQSLDNASAGADHTSIEWRKLSGMIGLSIKIFFLRIITLGIYHFWGKTETRRRIWSGVHIEGQPLEYTGTGKELFLGFLIVFFLILLPLFAILIGIQFLAMQTFGFESPMVDLALLPVYPVFFYLFGVAQYRARRYRLSRTNWRGIRGAMAGSPWKYGWTALWTLIPVMLTLGWLVPWRSTKLQRILTQDTRFGDEPMRFTAGAKPLYGRFAILWFGTAVLYGGTMGILYALFSEKLMVATMAKVPLPFTDYLQIAVIVFIALVLYAVVSASYYSKLSNHFANHTFIQNARFNLETRTGSLIGLILGNTLISLFTLGILTPVVQGRLAGYFAARTSIEGAIDFNTIAQSQAALDSTGEGLAEAFDIDAF
jgi:uncharacterized membrane protein YjgN (DUF898 family)